MITKIEIEGFKSLEKVTLALGDLNLFIGTNASGKSNFFDALRVLQGVGYGYTIEEILNGKPKSANSEVWDGIRGGSVCAAFSRISVGEDAPPERNIRFILHMRDASSPGTIVYTIAFSPVTGSIREESLIKDDRQIYDSESVENPMDAPVFKVKYFHGKKGTRPYRQFEKSRPVLHQLLTRKDCSKQHASVIERCIKTVTNMQRIDPSPTVLRQYSQAQSVKRMGEHGENFAALIKTILGDEKLKAAYLSWLEQLTPTEVDDIAVLPGALGEPLFAIKEKGVDYPAPILSDGTLRFAAIAAAFFQPDLPDILTIEEIENGIHPSRLRLLVELLKSQSVRSNQQIMATTHSPVVLSWLKEADYKTAFFCKRDETTGASHIVPLAKVPGFLEVVREHPVLDLFTEGWLESAL